MLKGLLACAAAFLLSCGAIMPVRALSWHLGAVDVPRDGRRMHQRCVPRCGGVAILGAFVLTGMLTLELDAAMRGVMAGAWLLFAVGLADDIYTLSPFCKLAVQTVAAAVACGAPLSGRGIGEMIWILLLCNAHNFIDGMDGLLAGSATVECMALGAMLTLVGVEGHGLLAWILGASCAGFWVFNRHPACIFAGDCGSATVGYLLGALSLPILRRMPLGVEAAAPLLLFAHPLTDLFCAVTRRLLQMRSPFCADRGHLHHRLFDAGLTQGQCSGVLHLLVGLLAAVAVLLWSGVSEGWTAVACAVSAAWMMAIGRRISRTL